MCRFDELQSPELVERDIAAGQFQFKGQAVVRSPEQNRLLLQRDTRFAVCKDLFDHVVGLFVFINDIFLVHQNLLVPERFSDFIRVTQPQK